MEIQNSLAARKKKIVVNNAYTRLLRTGTISTRLDLLLEEMLIRRVLRDTESLPFSTCIKLEELRKILVYHLASMNRSDGVRFTKKYLDTLEEVESELKLRESSSRSPGKLFSNGRRYLSEATNIQYNGENRFK